MSGPAVMAGRHGRKSMVRRGKGLCKVEEWHGGRACWGGSMTHLTPTCPLLNQARPLSPLTNSLLVGEAVQLFRDEFAQADADACSDLLVSYKKKGYDKMREVDCTQALTLKNKAKMLSVGYANQ